MGQRVLWVFSHLPLLIHATPSPTPMPVDNQEERGQMAIGSPRRKNFKDMETLTSVQWPTEQRPESGMAVWSTSDSEGHFRQK